MGAGRLGRIAGAVSMAALAVLGPVAPSAASVGAPPGGGGVPTFDEGKLRVTLEATHAAGMYGIYSAVRDGDREWEDAAGVADVRTKRPVTPHMRHRVGSVTKTFVATAVLQQVEQGRIGLDVPIGAYLPGVVNGERGRKVTVRMLLNHTSGIGDYVTSAFPSLRRGSPQSLDAERFRHVRPEQLVAWGLAAPATNAPGADWSYSNTNYILAGLLLEKVTGQDAETYIDRNVIRRAGLHHTSFPRNAFVPGANSHMYEALYGRIDPPRDYSVYDMSWAWTAGALVSTTGDLNRFYRALLSGELIGTGTLAAMRRAVPVKNDEGVVVMRYGLGLYAVDLPCGRFWGHDGAVFGAGTQSLSTPDGHRQVSVGFNLTKYQELNGDGVPVPHAIDNALGAHLVQAACGGPRPMVSRGAGAAPVLPLPLEFVGPRAG